MPKSKKNNTKPKLNMTVREEQRKKLEQMAALEKRSVSNLIEVMADERWERLVEQQGIAYAKTVAEAMNLKLDINKPADRVDNLSKAGWSWGYVSALDCERRTIWIVDAHCDDETRLGY